MAYLTSFEFNPTGDDIIDVATQGSVWNLSQTNVIHWTIADGWLGESWANPDFTVSQIDQALSIIQQYIDIDFQFGGYFTDPYSAGAAGSDLVYSLYGDDRYGANPTWAVGFFPNYNDLQFGGYPGWQTQAGDIFLNANHPVNEQTTFELGSAGFALILHETFHALGLKHTKDSYFGRPSLSELGFGEFDQDWVSVMTYNEQFPLELNKWEPATPMLLDVLALQYLYGPNWNANTGNDIYYLSDEPFYATIWDAGGIDLVDLSNVQEGWSVTLPNVQLSTLVSTKAGSALPVSQTSSDTSEVPAPTNFFWLTGDIENVLGSNYADEITGNDLNNWMRGAAGDDYFYASKGSDVLDGGDGIDTAVYSGNQASYTLTLSPNSTSIEDRRITDRGDSQDGTDTLIDVENLQFSNGAFDIGIRSGAVELSTEDFAAITELYIAYFDRAPAAKGLLYWATRLDDGMKLPEIAESFFVQPETQKTYEAFLSDNGSLIDTGAFVKAVFNNVLGRDPSGPYWVNELDTNPEITPAIFILAVLNGAKALTGGAADAAYLETKTDIGVYFSAIKGLSDYDDTVSVMNLFDGSAASVTSAVAEIDRLYVEALDPNTGEFLMPLVGVIDDPFAVA